MLETDAGAGGYRRYELGRARLVLAKLRWRDPNTRAEARQLAQSAASDLATQTRDAGPLRDARVWVATH